MVTANSLACPYDDIKIVCFLPRVLFFSNPLFCMRLVASFDNGMLMVAEFIFIYLKVNTLSVIFMLFDVVTIIKIVQGKSVHCNSKV